MKSFLTKWHTKINIFQKICFCIPLLTGNILYNAENISDAKHQTAQSEKRHQEFKRIKDIIVQGNKHVPTTAILYRVPFKVGEQFNPIKTGKMIRNMYKELKRLRNITIKGKDLNDEYMNLYIVVEEKYPLKEVQFVGNTQVSSKDINKKINFSEIPAIDKEELAKFVNIIKKLYVEKGYHRVDIQPELVINQDGTATAVFKFKEYKKSMIKQIIFKGNHHISSKKLASTIMTREEWVLSLLDKAGSFNPDRLEADRHFIELLYQSNGFLHAKLIDIHVDMDPKTSQLIITYEIEEGEQYYIKEVKAPGNDILTEEQLLAALPVRPGQIYSRELIANSIQILEMIWGNRGYAYAHIEPSIIPDDETKTVNLAFYSDIGSKVYLNKVTIKGNKKTRDKVIRRNISLVEGEPITNFAMEDSKNRIESLGYFDQKEGVNWKTTRLSEDLADLDLLVKEAPTGTANVKVGVGGSERDIKSVIKGFSAEANVADRNLFGSGIQLNFSGRLAVNERSLLFTLADPWLFDRPLFGKFDFYYRHVSYDEFRLTQPINERDCGGNVTLGFVTALHKFASLRDMFVRTTLGFDSIRYESHPQASITGLIPQEQVIANASYQSILDKIFMPGEYLWLAANLGQDTKNHPVHPSRGTMWLLRAILAVPSLGSCVAYQKFDFDFNWYTPLIGEHDLIFRFHAFFGYVHSFSGHFIPYRELFNIGGPASVRGYLFGQIAPVFYVNGVGDPIGGSKAFFWNAELIFPITQDFNMKGVLFYDGGSGWDNPYVGNVPQRFIRNNNFDYRQSVGAGFRVYNPIPLRVDWGFKLDPRKGESPYEVHFGMAYDW